MRSPCTSLECDTTRRALRDHRHGPLLPRRPDGRSIWGPSRRLRQGDREAECHERAVGAERLNRPTLHHTPLARARPAPGPAAAPATVSAVSRREGREGHQTFFPPSHQRRCWRQRAGTDATFNLNQSISTHPPSPLAGAIDWTSGLVGSCFLVRVRTAGWAIRLGFARPRPPIGHVSDLAVT